MTARTTICPRHRRSHWLGALAQWCAMASAMLWVSACGGDRRDENTAATSSAVALAASAADAANRRGSSTSPSAPLSSAELESKLPTRVEGMVAGAPSRQDVDVMGVRMSVAQRSYTEGRRKISVVLTDAGTAAAMAPMAAGWAMIEFDRSTRDGTERTTRVRGYKAVEKVRRRSNDRIDTEIAVLVGQRVVVQVKGVGVELDEVRRVVEELDLGFLERGR